MFSWDECEQRINILSDRQIYPDKQTDRSNRMNINRQFQYKNGQTLRQTARQTDRQTDRHNHRRQLQSSSSEDQRGLPCMTNTFINQELWAGTLSPPSDVVYITSDPNFLQRLLNYHHITERDVPEREDNPILATNHKISNSSISFSFYVQSLDPSHDIHPLFQCQIAILLFLFTAISLLGPNLISPKQLCSFLFSTVKS